MNEENLRRRVLEKACELACGKINDAVKLAYLSEEDLSVLDSLDLSALSGIHRAANGGVELKMTDRLKLIEMILSATEPEPDGSKSGAAELIGALNRAAEKLASGGAADGRGDS